MTGVLTGAARAGPTSALAAAGLTLGVSAAAQVVRHDGAVTSAVLVLVFLLTVGVAHTLGGMPHRSLPTALPAALLALGLAVACPGGRWGLLLGGACCAVAAGVVAAVLVPRAAGGAPGPARGSGSRPGSGFHPGSGFTPDSDFRPGSGFGPGSGLVPGSGFGSGPGAGSDLISGPGTGSRSDRGPGSRSASGSGPGSGSGSASGAGAGVSVRVAVSVLGLAVVLGWVVAAVRLPEARAAASAVACCCGLLQLTRAPVSG
ncbi:hypothetical protein [Streptomyces tendae]|uniref:hypothetical protein n=1 Tax=Streptomyces tendae TaxID=1932 RepID=UPI003D71CE35